MDSRVDRKRGKELRVYQVSFDGDLFLLEAESFGAAVERWKIWMKNDYKEDYELDWEPDEVLVMRNGFVLDRKLIDEWMREEKEKKGE